MAYFPRDDNAVPGIGAQNSSGDATPLLCTDAGELIVGGIDSGVLFINGVATPVTSTRITGVGVNIVTPPTGKSIKLAYMALSFSGQGVFSVLRAGNVAYSLDIPGPGILTESFEYPLQYWGVNESLGFSTTNSVTISGMITWGAM